MIHAVTFMAKGDIPMEKILPMMRFFIINFYNDNRVVEFEKEQPEEGYLLVGEKDYPHIAGKYSDKYKFTDILKSPRKGNDVKDIIHIYQFEKIK